MKGQIKRLFFENTNKTLFLFLIITLFISAAITSKSVPYDRYIQIIYHHLLFMMINIPINLDVYINIYNVMK